MTSLFASAPGLHGFGARYDLPLTLALYLYAAAGVVVLSFVMVAVLAGDRVGERALAYPTRRSGLLTRAAASPWPGRVGAVLGWTVLVVTVVTGLFGSQDRPDLNPSEYLLWIYFWAALLILAGLVGNLWPLVNPWSALGARLEPARPRILPAWVGAWPAILLYAAFAWFELCSRLSNHPALLAATVLGYTLLMLAGIRVYGREQWLAGFDFVSILFDLVGRCGFFERRADGEVRLRPFGSGLLAPYPAGWDRVLFIVMTLSTLAFDGVVATSPWLTIQQGGAAFEAAIGDGGEVILRTLGLVALTLLFLAVYYAFIRVVIFLGTARVRFVPTVTAFALTLVPIALVYNAAHNYSYLVVQSQRIIPALADPFGKGWQLYPTSGFTANFALATPAIVWWVQVILIVLGHVVAVYLAHLRAGERFRSARNALLSQYPMLLLMVLYTMTSLWILAQPITREG